MRYSRPHSHFLFLKPFSKRISSTSSKQIQHQLNICSPSRTISQTSSNSSGNSSIEGSLRSSAVQLPKSRSKQQSSFQTECNYKIISKRPNSVGSIRQRLSTPGLNNAITRLTSRPPLPLPLHTANVNNYEAFLTLSSSGHNTSRYTIWMIDDVSRN